MLWENLREEEFKEETISNEYHKEWTAKQK